MESCLRAYVVSQNLLPANKNFFVSVYKLRVFLKSPGYTAIGIAFWRLEEHQLIKDLRNDGTTWPLLLCVHVLIRYTHETWGDPSYSPHL